MIMGLVVLEEMSFEIIDEQQMPAYRKNSKNWDT